MQADGRHVSHRLLVVRDVNKTFFSRGLSATSHSVTVSEAGSYGEAITLAGESGSPKDAATWEN
jgi:hypothetical protein